MSGFRGRLGGPHARRAAAERSYPGCEVRGGGPEEIPSVRGQGRRREELPGVRGQGLRWKEIPHAPSLRPGATGERSYPTPLSPRPRAAAGRSNPMFKKP